MKKTVIVLVIVAVSVAGVTVWGRSSTARSRPVAESVRQARVERGDLLVSVNATGRILPRTEADLSFDLPGKVTQVWVEPGAMVETGEGLVQLDDTQLAFQVREAEIALEAAQAQLDQLLADARPEEVAAAEANLAASQAGVWDAAERRDLVSAGASEGEIAAAEAQLAAATARQKTAQIMYDMTIRCERVTLPDGQEQEICPGLGAPEEQARYELHAANAELAAAQTQLDQLLAGPKQGQVDSARANVSAAAAQRDALQAQLDLLLAGASEHQIAATQAQVDQARLALERARAELEKTRLAAPFAGTVTAVSVREQEMVAAGVPVVSLADVSEWQLKVKVDEIDVAQVREGQQATITVDALPGATISGTVKRIAPAASRDSNGLVVYQLTITLAETAAPLRAGMSATAAIAVERLEDVLLVPHWAIRMDRETGQTLVRVLRGETVEEVALEIGVRGVDVSQALSGLQEGDVVVAGELQSVRDLLSEGE